LKNNPSQFGHVFETPYHLQKNQQEQAMRIIVFLMFLLFGSVPVYAGQGGGGTSTALFAGGCFWCVESEYESQAGVLSVVSGYAGAGDTAPTYEQVSSGKSGFIEAVEVTYDPAKVSYQTLLDIFWRNVDPFDPDGQFCDQGSQYVAAIFPANDEEKKMAEDSLKAIEAQFEKPVATQILVKTNFYKAEEYHQDFYKTNAAHYKRYKNACGRDARLNQIWNQ
jgi:peptide-methionine (S)-S-oxide reductase